MAAVAAAIEQNAGAIIVMSTSGNTARLVSKFKPPCPIITITRNEQTSRQIHLHRGCYPMYYEEPKPTSDEGWQVDVDNRIRYGLSRGLELGIVRKNDTIVAIQGWRAGGGSTNTVSTNFSHLLPPSFDFLTNNLPTLDSYRCVFSQFPNPTKLSSFVPSRTKASPSLLSSLLPFAPSSPKYDLFSLFRYSVSLSPFFPCRLVFVSLWSLSFFGRCKTAKNQHDRISELANLHKSIEGLSTRFNRSRSFGRCRECESSRDKPPKILRIQRFLNFLLYSSLFLLLLLRTLSQLFQSCQSPPHKLLSLQLSLPPPPPPPPRNLISLSPHLPRPKTRSN